MGLARGQFWIGAGRRLARCAARGAGRAGLAALLSLGAASALAGEPAPENPLVGTVSAFETLVAQHAKEKADEALVLDARRGTVLFKEVAADPLLKKRVLSAMEAGFKSVKEAGPKVSILASLAATGDPAVARIVKPLLRQANPKVADPLLLAAIQAASKVPASELVEPLLALVDDSKSMEAAQAALTSLGAFGKLKSKRVKILESLVKSVEKCQPGGRPGFRPGPGGIDDSAPGVPPPADSAGPTARWAALSPLLPAALNALTGQNVPTPSQWFQIVKDTADLDGIFRST